MEGDEPSPGSRARVRALASGRPMQQKQSSAEKRSEHRTLQAKQVKYLSCTVLSWGGTQRGAG